MLRILLAALVLAACNDAPDACHFRSAADDVTQPPLATPRWAFSPWISKDISDGADTRAFVAGFQQRDIPVGTVVLDSPWETHYNTLIPNPNRYPDFADMVAELHGEGIHVVLWTTQMVNKTAFDLEPGGDTYTGPAPNYEPGQRCGFFVDHGADYLWWKGLGAGVDFFNPEAVGWWHRQQDVVLDAGIDGWKLDFGDEYLGDTVDTHAGTVERQQYSEQYYADFLAYGVSRRGPDFVTMVRPWDQSYGFPGRFYARPEDARVAWVGDNRRDWVGLADALDEIFKSATAGYVVLGSDIGGYLDRDDVDLSITLPFDTMVFARWTAFGALVPFMELQSRANVAPWTVPDHVDETVALYRYWATLHSEMVPFWLSLARTAQAGGPPLLRPQGDPSTWAGDYRYMIGDALLVAPILDATGTRDIALPDGNFYDWWHPGDPAIAGGQTLAGYAMPERERFPLFVREGAIIPMDVASDVTGLGTPARGNALTVLAWPAASATSFDLIDEDDAHTTISAAADAIDLSRALRPTYLRIRRDAAPTSIAIDGAPPAMVADDATLDGATAGWFYDATNRWLWIKIAPSASAVHVAIVP